MSSKQALRCCLCVHCHTGKLTTKSLVRLWPTLRQGGSPCDCGCVFGVEERCGNYLPYTNPKDNPGVAEVCKKLTCSKVPLDDTRAGRRVDALSNSCVTGHCTDRGIRQVLFFECPKHGAGTQGTGTDEVLNARVNPSRGSVEESQPEIAWQSFAPVDGDGDELTRTRRCERSCHGDGGNMHDGDEDFQPSGGGTGRPTRKVCDNPATILSFKPESKSVPNPHSCAWAGPQNVSFATHPLFVLR